jgi:hypothetical protein
VFRGIGSGIGMRLRTKVILWLLALGVVVTLVIFSEEPGFPKPPDTCSEKGIDPSQMNEGTCVDEGSTLHVVDIGDTLTMRTLKARLEGLHETGSLVTFDLQITNRGSKPAYLGKEQLVLRLDQDLGEDIAVEKRSEPHSFLAHRHPIQPGETVNGTVVFQVTPAEQKQLHETGNLDIANFGRPGDATDAKSVLSGSEIGVMRTYQHQ